MNRYSPLETAMALSLYAFNVPPIERAHALCQHFGMDLSEAPDLISNFSFERAAFLATTLSTPFAAIYVQQALSRYGLEARERCRVNLAGTDFECPDDVFWRERDGSSA